MRNHHDGGWITVPWTHLRTAPLPFGEMAWEHAQKIVSQIAQVVDALLDKAGQGPTDSGKPSKASRRVAGRTCATTRRPAKTPAPDPDPREADSTEEPREDSEADSGTLAEVIPLGVFDAREEAKHWW